MINLNIIQKFEIPYYQYLNAESVLVADIPKDLTDHKNLISLYKIMVLSRLFDSKAIMLQRTGKIGTYPSMRGQEAVFAGIGNALGDNDVFVPYYRDLAALLQRGVRLRDSLLFWGGDERGNCNASQILFPNCIPIGSQLLHAAGAATAVKIKKEKRAVLVTCGDGATSQGDFYEAMNVAGVWELPIVFVVSNNQWAISVSRDKQTKAATLAQKALAAGFAGEQVDGNDIIAIKHRVSIALQKAREKNQPTLLELICYRQSDHTTADDASRYEPKGSREFEWKKEPIARLKLYLENCGVWSAQDEEQLQKDCKDKIEKEVAAYLAIPDDAITVMFDYLYENLPEEVKQQRAEVLARENHND